MLSLVFLCWFVSYYLFIMIEIAVDSQLSASLFFGIKTTLKSKFIACVYISYIGDAPSLE